LNRSSSVRARINDARFLAARKKEAKGSLTKLAIAMLNETPEKVSA
jgi:hypothetical protein